MKKPNRDILCGHLIVDFANSKTSDEAGLNIIDNIQKIFELPLQFTDEAQNKFPQLNSFFLAFTPIEKDLFQLFINEINLHLLIGESSGSVCLAGYNYDLENYDYGEDRTLLFEIYTDPLGHEESIYRTIKIGKSDKRNHEKLKNMFYEYTDPRYPKDDKDHLFAEFFRLIPEYVRTGDMILEILHAKKLVSQERYKQIEKMAYHYLGHLQNEHGHINEIRKDLQICFDSILNKFSSNREVFTRFLSIYNSMKSSILYVTDEGNIAEKPSFNVNILLTRDDDKNSYFYFPLVRPGLPVHRFDECKCIYHQIIAYCLFHYLANTENKKKLKKCPLCEMFFIAEDTKRVKCYSSECQRIYARLKKQKQREDDPEKYI